MKQDIPLIALLDELELQMHSLGCWQSEAPSAEALASTEPFAIDTLEPQQWLQWIFLPKIRAMINAQQSVPSGFSMVGYFEQSWQQQAQYAALLTVIRRIDQEVA
ncbi:YqcC family protein [Vibrio renipiscarius]|uniref:Pseudouridine synthase n=1 Tax=Vibrio renipiscarius TaxID=1461322 RepID=A0A0C2NBE4_9VIBR|nr:YqcC family protein [Vibrio renipiscarius]KII76832.1 pseudouridine synthase [Vibrio renipiscarius]KII76961.1 pseudouridine synthase [Vibrio renipiscarius]